MTPEEIIKHLVTAIHHAVGQALLDFDEVERIVIVPDYDEQRVRVNAYTDSASFAFKVVVSEVPSL